MNNMSIIILVIDDDEEIRKVLGILLKQTGYDFVEASDAETTFQILRDRGNEIGVVICDIKMPKVSGIDILERIRQEFDTLPVIVLSGLVDLNVAVEVMKKGAFDFLTKPIKKNDLILVIEKALNHKRFLEEHRKLAQSQRRTQEMIDEKAKELESASFLLNKIREDLLKLKRKQMEEK